MDQEWAARSLAIEMASRDGAPYALVAGRDAPIGRFTSTTSVSGDFAIVPLREAEDAGVSILFDTTMPLINAMSRVRANPAPWLWGAGLTAVVLGGFGWWLWRSR